MSNIKIVYDCEKKTTSYIPLSGAEIAEREAAAIAAPLIEELPALKEAPAE